MPDPATMIVFAIMNAKGHLIEPRVQMDSFAQCEKFAKQETDYYNILEVKTHYTCAEEPYEAPKPPGRSMGGVEGTQFDRNSPLFHPTVSSPSAPK